MLPSVVLPRLKRPTRVDTIGGVAGTMEIYSGTVTSHADTSRVTQPRLVLVTTSKHCDMQTAVALHGYKC